MKIDNDLVNLSIYLPFFAGIIISFIHIILKSIKKCIRDTTSVAFVFDIVLSVIIIFINMYVFYLSNYGCLKAYSLIVEMISYIISRKIFIKLFYTILIKFLKKIRKLLFIMCKYKSKIYKYIYNILNKFSKKT